MLAAVAGTLALCASPALARAATPKAHAAIMGGAPVAISQAPWQVAVRARISEGSTALVLLCGGSILDGVHILTAAHCTIDPKTGHVLPAEDFAIRAGTDNLAEPEPGEVRRSVTGVRVHPYYTYAPTGTGPDADDVAVLTLEQPLPFGSLIRAIALSPLGAGPSEGTVAALTGFGEQNPTTKEADGRLYGLQMGIVSPQACGGEEGRANAVLVCATSPTGSACHGDSGSPLTPAGAPPVLAGVADTVSVVEGKSCAAGSLATFANVAAGEIQDFVEGSESPPVAPRGGGASCEADRLAVGGTMSCVPGGWTGEPAFTYTFLDGASGRLLQSGPSDTYRFTPADVGHSVAMQLQAVNAGGTGIDRTAPTQAIAPAPRRASRGGGVRLVDLAVRAGRKAVYVRLRCLGGSTCRGALLLTARAGGARTALARASFAVVAHATRTFRLALARGALALIGKAPGGRLAARLLIYERTPVPPWTHARSVRLSARR